MKKGGKLYKMLVFKCFPFSNMNLCNCVDILGIAFQNRIILFGKLVTRAPLLHTLSLNSIKIESVHNVQWKETN